MKYGDLVLYRRLLARTRPYWLNLLGIFLLGLLATPLSLLAPVPLALAVDSVLGDQQPPNFLAALLPESVVGSDSSMLIVAAALVIVVALLTQAQEAGASFLKSYTGEKLVLDFRNQLFRHMQNLSLSYHDAVGTSDSTYRIQYDASAIRYIAVDGLLPFVTATISFVSMLYVTFLLDRQLALVALAISPVLFLIVRSYRMRLRRQARRLKVLESSALSVVQEVLTSVRVVKAFGQEDREQERFVSRSSEGAEARVRVTFAESVLALLLGLTMAVGTAAVLYFGVGHVQAGTLTLGELLLIMAYLTQLYGPLKTISRKMASLQSHLASAERALSVLDEVPDVSERPGAHPLARARGDFLFDNVSFGYGADRPTLEGFSIEIPGGTRVGIAGETGAGKSTFVNLLTRFYDPTAGRIILDGADLRDYRLSDLRDQFSIVLQDPVLFSTSIAENIAYACPGATTESITAAAQAANAHDFIARLADGYETQVGERGVLLSGGERQRIALARAFLKDAPILILDEPTSSVDVETEAAIMEAMNRLVTGRTCFMIAHRLNTLRGCDLLLTIEDGRLVRERNPAAVGGPRVPVPRGDEVALRRGLATSRRGAPSLVPEQLDGVQSVAASTGRTAPIVWRESADELAELYRAEDNIERRKRLHVLWLLRCGQSQAHASIELGISQRTIRRWVAWYRADGLEEVLRRTRGNRSHGTRATDEHSQLVSS